MINLKYVLGAACLSLSMAAFVPSTFAQAAGAGVGGAPTTGASSGATNTESAARGTGPAGNNGSAATSPSTLGGSVSGSSSAPASGHMTAGDHAVHPHSGARNESMAAVGSHSSSPMSPSRYDNSRHVNMSANRSVQRREEHSMRNRRHREEQEQYGSNTNYGSNSNYANRAGAE